MAKVISDEILKLKIVINGYEAQKQILDLENANRKLSKSIDEEKQKLKELRVNRRKNAQEIVDIEKNIKSLTTEYDKNLKSIDGLIREMDISSLTVSQLNRRIQELAFTMKHVDPNTMAYKEMQKEMDALTYRQRELKSGMGATAFSIKELSDKINQYSAFITMAVIAITTMVIAIRDVIDINNKLADAMSAVEKTTGLAKSEVKELSDAFKEFDTRTSQLDLLKIAEIGGRLGVAKEEILGFTREIDKVYVALGDGFAGGVEKVAESLGKLKGLFAETRDLPIVEAMNQIGSAINELGAAGAATEENIAEFGLRVGSLPAALKPTIADALALGAAFEESGIVAERSGTAYSNFLRVAAKNIFGFSKVMGESKEEMEKLINTDPTEFFLKFAEGAKGLESTTLAQILGDLKLNDQYVIQIIGAASENTDRFRKSIALSNKSLIEATSLQEEFNKVNNNAAAIYDKIKKKFSEMFSSDTIVKPLTWIITKFGQFMGVVEDADGTVTGFRHTLVFFVKILAIAATAVLSYNAAVLLSSKVFTEAQAQLLGYTIAQKVYNVYTQASTFLTNLWTASVARAQLGLARLTGNTALQTAAQTKLNAVTMANPYAALLAIVLAVAAAYALFAKNAKEAAEEEKKRYEQTHRYQSLQNEILEQGKQAVNEYKDGVSNLIAVLKDENASQQVRKKAYEALIKIHPEFMGTVDKEYMATAKLAQVYEELARQIDISARVKARAAAKEGLYKDIAQSELDYIRGATARKKEQEDRDKFRKEKSVHYDMNNPEDRRNLNMMTSRFVGFAEHNKGDAILAKIRQDNAVLKQFNDEEAKRIKYLTEAVKTATGSRKKELEIELYGLLGVENNNDTKSTYRPLPDEEKGKKKPKEKKTKKSQYEKDLEEIFKLSEKYGAKNLDFAAELEKRRIEIMYDGYEKEQALLYLESSEKERAYEKQKISAEDMAKLNDVIAKTKNKKIKVRLEEERFIWKQHNDRLTQLQLQETEITNAKLGVLYEKYRKDYYKKEEEDLNKHLKQIDREKNEKLALATISEQKDFLKTLGYTPENLDKIKTWEEGRAAIEKEYQKKKLIENLDFLKQKVAEFNAVSQFSLLSLSPEQQKTIEEYRNKIAELTAEIVKLKNGEDGKKGNKRDRGSLSDLGRNTDILGLNPKQWEALFANTDSLTGKIEKISAAILVAKNMFATYAEFMAANEASLLKQYEYGHERRKTTLDKQLKAGLINQEQFKKKTIENDTFLDKKKAELEYKAAKRQRAMQIAETISNTAMAIMKIWAEASPFFAPILTGIVSAIGAIQLATIMSQPLPEAPGAEDGYYPVLRKQDGKLFNARRRQSASGVYDEPTMLVGEQGKNFPELVVSGRTLKRIDPAINQMYMREISRVEGFENGLTPKNTVTSSGSDEMLIRMMAVLEENTAVMREIKDYGIQATIAQNAQNGQKIDKMLNEYKELYNRNKH